MLVNCKPGCAGKKVTTNALLDVETNQVICEHCQEIIEISSFVKNSMKQRGEIVKTAKKPFQFECLTCKKEVATEVANGTLIGVNCKKQCKFNVSPFMVQAMKNTAKISKNEDDEIDE